MTVTTSVLDRGRTQLVPAMQAAVARLDPSSRLHVSYHLGWCDVDGNPTPQRRRQGHPAGAGDALRRGGRRAGTRRRCPARSRSNWSTTSRCCTTTCSTATWSDGTARRCGRSGACRPRSWPVTRCSRWPTRSCWRPTGRATPRAVPPAGQVTRELTRGQTQDLAFEKRDDVTLDECLDMAGGKTGSLLAARGVDRRHPGRCRRDQGGRAEHLRCPVRARLPARRRRPRHLGRPGGDRQVGLLGPAAPSKKSLPVTWALAHSRHGAADARLAGTAATRTGHVGTRSPDLLDAGRRQGLGARRGGAPDGAGRGGAAQRRPEPAARAPT